LRRIAALAILVGCAGPAPTPTPVIEPVPAPPGGVIAGELPTELPETGPNILLSPVNLSPLYANYFGSEGPVTALSRELGALGWTGSVAIEVAWDEVNKAGTITMFVPERDEHAARLIPALEAGGAVDGRSLQALIAPLGRYRAALGGRFDLRILAFNLRLSWWDRSTGSHCSGTGDFNDPDGRRLGPCFRCLEPRFGGMDLCREGEEWPGVIAGDKAGLRMLQRAWRAEPLY